MKKNKQSPASGEQSAIRGYRFQYEVAARLIIQYLRQKKLKWIKFIDPIAGHLDDIQLNISGTVYAYQVKYSHSSTYISFKQIFAGDNSLIFQLANGWKRLKKENNSVKVCFLTNREPSINDRVYINSHHQSFKNFFDNEWQNKNSFSKGEISQKWKLIWDKIIVASGLSESEFQEFIKDCELIFSFKPLSEDNSYTNEEERDVFSQDVNKIIELIQSSIANNGDAPIYLTDRDLLYKLGWNNRIEYINIHNFPIDDKIYETIKETKDKLFKAIEELESGYILLQGSPGSGKSSLLSKELINTSKTKIIKYFSYIPDDTVFSHTRGESINFLHDISKSLEDIGYKVGESLSYDNENFLLNRLQRQFQEIHKQYQSSNKKIVIIVDGLDHIEREMNLNNSFLKSLPLPSFLPRGVIFLISSQLDRLNQLPSEIEQQINEPIRKIKMNKLSKESVLNIIRKSSLEVDLNDNQRFTIFTKCENHPLALKLIMKKISNSNNQSELDSALNNIDKFDQSIDKTYYSHWKKIRNDSGLVRLLGLVSRMTGGIDWDWISEWEDQNVIYDFQNKLYFYFDVKDEKWYFFHNSFRVFIEHKSIETPYGSLDKNEDKKLHKFLAEKIQISSDKFGEIFHLHKAEEYQKIIDISTQSYFKNQIDRFIHPFIVLNDIKFAILACKKKNNFKKIFDLLLSASIANSVNYYLFRDQNFIKLINLLLSLNNNERAISYIRRGQTLLISKIEVMKCILYFVQYGNEKEARLLFDLSEPNELLFDTQQSIHILEHELLNNKMINSKYNSLEEWANNAPYFYSAETICDQISSLQIKIESSSGMNKSYCQSMLIYQAGITFINTSKWNDLDIVLNSLKELNQNLYFHLLQFVWRKAEDCDNKDIAEKYFNLVREVEIEDDVQNLILAEGYFTLFHNIDKAKDIISKIQYPQKLVKIYDNFDSLKYRFKLIRLMSALNMPFQLENLIPDSEEEKNRGLILLERNFGKLAILFGEYWSGKNKSFKYVKDSILSLIQFYNKDFKSLSHWDSHYFIPQTKVDFFSVIIKFIKTFYPNKLPSMFKLFQNQWNAKNKKSFWDNEIKMEIISNFSSSEDLLPILTPELNNLRDNVKIEPIFQQIDFNFSYANLLIRFNQKEQANKILKDMTNCAIGIRDNKDDQLISWVDFLGEYNKLNPTAEKERIETFVKYLNIVDKSSEQYGRDVICEKLIQISSHYSSHYAFELSQRLLNDKFISFAEYIDYLTSALLKNDYISIKEGILIIKYIFLPISNYNECLSINTIIEKLKNHEKDEIKKLMSEIIESIDIHLIPSKRNNVKRTMVHLFEDINFDCSHLNIEWNDIRDTQSSSDNYELNINKKKLNMFELEKRISSVSDIIDLKTKTISDSFPSFFRWNELIKRKTHLVTVNDFPILRETFNQDSDWNDILYHLSQHFYQSEKKELSLKLANEFFNTSKSYGWVDYIDGGTRVKAFKLLKNHLPQDEFKTRIMNTLVNDLLTSGGGGFLFVAQEFNIISKLMYNDIPIQSLWPCIENYLSILFDSHSEIKSSYSNENMIVPDDKFPIIYKILLPLLNHNINLISQGAYSSIHYLFLKMKDNDVIDTLIDKADEEQQIFLLNILKGIIFYDPSKKFLVPIQKLKMIQSDNFYIRVLVQDILKELETDTAYHIKKSSRNSTVRMIYELELPRPKPSRLEGTEDYDFTRILQDTDNPFENVRMYELYIKYLSEVSVIPSVNLATRTVQIMDTLSNNYGARAEKELRLLLENQNLKLPFRRPRALVAKRAICHLIAELVDLEKIEVTEALQIMHEFKYIDSLLIALQWSRKPEFIRYQFSKKLNLDNWLNEPIVKDQLIIGKTFGSMIVVGELRKVGMEYMNRPEEEVTQILSLSDDQLIRFNNKCLYEDYFNKSGQFDILYLNLDMEFDTEQSNWLAINPILMKKYRMQLCRYRPFTWVSQSNKVVAQTICWKNGVNRQYNDEYGKGMIVILDKSILDKILLENKVYLKADRKRIYMKNGRVIDNSTIFCEPYS